jgi:hypothetical protein
MKFCPKCNQTYTDATLNFCLNDGSQLTEMNNQQAPPTVFMPQARQTSEQANQNNQSVQTVWQPAKVPNINTPKPQKKSRVWLWVLGIFGVFVVFGAIGFVGLLVFIGANIEDTENKNKNSGNEKKIVDKKDDKRQTNENKLNKETQKDDFAGWNYDDPTLGTAEYNDGKLIMNGGSSGYFFVLTTPDKDFVTYNAKTKISVINADNISTKFGYGIIINSEPIKPLTKDYAFIIDSNKQRYRIVKHNNLKETIIVDWKKTTAIYSGSAENILEIDHSDNEMSFSINGEFLTTVKDDQQIEKGIVGLYVSDTKPVTFSNLEITKNN